MAELRQKVRCMPINVITNSNELETLLEEAKIAVSNLENVLDKIRNFEFIMQIDTVKKD